MFQEDRYGYNFSNEVIIKYLGNLKNSIYKLLPLREENKDWKKYLESLNELELKGCEYLFIKIDFLKLIVKLNSLYNKNFYLYRKGIFESLKIVDDMIKEINSQGDINE